MTEFETSAEAAGPTSDPDEQALVLTQHVAAPPALVWPLLVDGEQMLRWMGTAVDIDPRPGGIFWLNATGTDIASGTYVEVDPPRRMVFSFGWEGSEDVPPASTTVTITLTPAPDNTTIVELRHDGLPGGEGDQHAEGWIYFLSRLGVVVAGGEVDPEPPTPDGV